MGSALLVGIEQAVSFLLVLFKCVPRSLISVAAALRRYLEKKFMLGENEKGYMSSTLSAEFVFGKG